MTERSSKAFFLSALLHGGAVALVLFFTYASSKTIDNEPKVFELVAGEGDNYAATEAPALGVPGGIKLDIPEPPTPVITPEPPSPEPPAVVPTPQPTPVKPVEQPKPAEKIPDFTKVVTRTIDRKTARIEAADKKKRLAEERKAKAAAAEAAKKMTKAEFDRQNAGKTKTASKTPSSTPTKVSKIDAEGIRSGVTGGSPNNKVGGAGGKALSRAEQDLMDSYQTLLKQRLRAAHEKPPGVSDLLQAEVRFNISASGVLSNVTIVRSSGNADFDQSVLAAFSRYRPIGPPPSGKADTWILTFKMRDEEG